MIALRTTHVTPLRRGAALVALSRAWLPGDPVVVWFFSQPTRGEMVDELYREFEWAPARNGANAFVRGFQLWVDAATDVSAIAAAVEAALVQPRENDS